MTPTKVTNFDRISKGRIGWEGAKCDLSITKKSPLKLKSYL